MSALLRAVTRAGGRRLAASALAIALGVAFTCATLLLGSSLERGYIDRAAGSLGDAAVVVVPASVLGPDAVAAIAARPGVTGVEPRVDHWVPFADGLFARVRTMPELTDTTRLVAGRVAAAPGELVVNQALAASGRLEPGSTLTVEPYQEWVDDEPDGGGDPSAEPALEDAEGQSFAVVGVLETGYDASDTPGAPEAYAPSEHLLDLAGGYRLVLVRGDVTPDTLASVPALGDEGTVIRTAAEYTAVQVEQFTQGTRATTTLLLIFSVIAFTVTALVIANTFGILVAQRTRQLALLRCVGASRRQVFGQVVGEALGTAAVAGVAGVGLGVGIVVALPRVLPDVATYTAVAPTPLALVAPWLAGIAVAAAAALVPARAATWVPPLAALRPALAASGGRATGRVRLAAGLALTVGGFALLGASVVWSQLVVGLAAGVGSFLGVLLLGPAIVPTLARALALPWRRRIVGRLAAENTVRNPRRAATTAGALLIGTTLVTMVLVGAATAQTTSTAAIDRRYPADLLVQGEVDAAARDAAAAVTGVRAAVLASAADITVVGAGGSASTTAFGLAPADVTALGWENAGAGLTDDVIVLPRSDGFADGSPVEVRGRAGSVTLTVRAVPQAGLVAVTPATVARLTSTAEHVMFVKVAPDADPHVVMADVRDALAGGGVWLSSAADARASITDAVTVALQVVLALLAVSVAISWVGVGNTLGLSVLERARETALLRALGLDRRDVRRLLGAEALLLGVVASALGVALGIGYGLAGAAVVLGARTPLVVDVPWWQVGAVVVVTVTSAWLASVLPGVRASRVPPAAALAED